MSSKPSQIRSQYASQAPSQLPGQCNELFRGYAEVAAKRPGAYTGSLSSRLPAGDHVSHAGPSRSEADQSDDVIQVVSRKVSFVS